MLNVNVQKISQIRQSFLTKQQLDTAVAAIEAYFNDESNFLNTELSVVVTLSPENYQLLVPQLQAVGLFSRTTPNQDEYTVFFSENTQPVQASVEAVSHPKATVNNSFAPPVEDLFQPTADPILEQAPHVEEELNVEIKDSIQKPVESTSSLQNPNQLFVIPDDVLTYTGSPF